MNQSGGGAAASASPLHQQRTGSTLDLVSDPAGGGVGAGETPYVNMDGERGGGGGSKHQQVVQFDGITIGHERTPKSSFRESSFKDNDDDDGVNSYAPSIMSSVLTADGISDTTGFAIVCFVILVGDMSRGVFFPTMWPLVQSVGGDTIMLGYAVAAFSFGRILSSPIFGSWSVKHGYTRTLQCSMSILIVGTLLYAQIGNVGKPEFLILAQTVLGVGSGTLGVTRAFCADVTPNRNRTTYMAWLTAVQYAGFTVTPIFGSIFVKIFSEDGSGIDAGFFQLNAFTAPAYFMTLVCSSTLVVLTTMFGNRHRSKNPPKKKSKRAVAKEEVSSARTLFGLVTVYDACILGCMLLNVSTKGSIASFETIGIAFAETHFDLYAAKAGAIVATCGSIGVVSLLCMGHLAKHFTDVQMIVGGMFVMIVGVLSITGLDEGVAPTWRYVVAIFLIYAIGYPIGHTAVIGLFSKIVGRRPQGTLLGWFASAGSVARMAFPIMSGYVAGMSDMRIVFVILTCVLGVAMCFTLLARKTLTTLSS